MLLATALLGPADWFLTASGRVDFAGPAIRSIIAVLAAAHRGLDVSPAFEAMLYSNQVIPLHAVVRAPPSTDAKGVCYEYTAGPEF